MDQKYIFIFLFLFIPLLSFSQLSDSNNISYNLFLIPTEGEIQVNANNAKAGIIGDMFKSELLKYPLKKGITYERNDTILFGTKDISGQGTMINLKIDIDDFEFPVIIDESGYVINATKKTSLESIEFSQIGDIEVIGNLNCHKYISANKEIIIFLSINNDIEAIKNYPLTFSPVGLPKGKTIVCYQRNNNKWILN